jgi:hypothetical protein
MWIECSKELPPINVPVLCAATFDGKKYDYHLLKRTGSFAAFPDLDVWTEIHVHRERFKVIDNRVTHWMVIPPVEIKNDLSSSAS